MTSSSFAFDSFFQICALAYMNWSFCKGIHSSFTLLSSWFVLCTCDGIRVASHILGNIDKVSVSTATFTLVIFPYIYFGLTMIDNATKQDSIFCIIIQSSIRDTFNACYANFCYVNIDELPKSVQTYSSFPVLGRNFNEIWIKLQNFSSKRGHSKISFAKCQPFYPGCVNGRYTISV